MNKITQEEVAAFLRDLGYAAEIRQGQQSRYVKTDISDLKVAVYFYDCDADGCGALQLSTGFDKSPNLTIGLANTWNSQHRYARAYVDPSDGSFFFEYDFVMTGVTKDFLKDNLSLYQQQLVKLKQQMN